MNAINSEEIKQKVQDFFGDFQPAEFQPCAFYHERLDCIRVLIKDCSVTETRVNEFITVLEDNHSEDKATTHYIGFTIKGIKYLCRKYGLQESGVIRLTELLDVVAKASPEEFVEVVVNAVLRPIAEESRVDSIELQAA